MKVTPALCRAAYEFMRAASFIGARLPTAKRVEFITNKLVHHGYYGLVDGQHTIWINKGTKTPTQLLQVVAHEMCHVALSHHASRTGDWHDEYFKALARSVELDMGWRKGSV